jgi:PHD/YefM family antitoxin component YafN of YafNO toxin-antitoxin module
MVYITRYDRPEAVVLSIEKFNALAGPDSSSLDDLTREFDDRLARMQSAEAAAGMDTFFELKSAELGEGALRSARRKPM